MGTTILGTACPDLRNWVHDAENWVPDRQNLMENAFSQARTPLTSARSLTGRTGRRSDSRTAPRAVKSSRAVLAIVPAFYTKQFKDIDPKV
ncbi:hypothetical protein, partial [Streptomyces sp. NPDC001966]